MSHAQTSHARRGAALSGENAEPRKAKMTPVRESLEVMWSHLSIVGAAPRLALAMRVDGGEGEVAHRVRPGCAVGGTDNDRGAELGLANTSADLHDPSWQRPRDRVQLERAVLRLVRRVPLRCASAGQDIGSKAPISTSAARRARALHLTKNHLRNTASYSRPHEGVHVAIR